jgi:TRAP-type C4-dicarboxylate transport system permease small subunit
MIVKILEVYIPAAALVVIFLVFNLQIFYRYVLNDPIRWANELSLMCFLWAVMLGAAYAWRKKDHVTFTILYDIIPAKGQLWMRVVGNVFIAISLLIVLYPVYDQLVFMQRLTSTSLNIPLHIVFSPMLVTFVLIIGHCITDIYTDIRKLLVSNGDYSEGIYKDEYEDDEDETIPTALKD